MGSRLAHCKQTVRFEPTLRKVRMKVLRVPIVLLSILIVGACDQEERPIPVGFYDSETTDERVVVTSKTIIFRINFDEQQPDKFVQRELEYHMYLDSNDMIRYMWRPKSALRDVDLFEWYWRDGKIAKISRKTGQTTWFVKSDVTSE